MLYALCLKGINYPGHSLCYVYSLRCVQCLPHPVLRLPLPPEHVPDLRGITRCLCTWHHSTDYPQHAPSSLLLDVVISWDVILALLSGVV